MHRIFPLLLFLCALKTVEAFGFDMLFDVLKSFFCLIPFLNLLFDCNPEEDVGNEDKDPLNLPITNLGNVTLPLLGLPLELLDPALVLSSSNPDLLNELLIAAEAAPIGEISFSVYLDLYKGTDGSLVIELDTTNPNYATLVGYPEFDITPAADGFYSADTILIIGHENTEDNIYRLNSIDPTAINDKKGGGDEKGKKMPTDQCCSILAVAHSLVRRMGGIVTKDSAVDGENWDPCFLWRVWAATGDPDYPNGDRGLSDDEGEAGHEANWNDAWFVRQIDDNSPLYDQGEELTCAQLKERCEKLKGRVEDTNDDVTMRPRGRFGKKGDEWGHRVPVVGVTYNAGPPCTCEIEIIRTSEQGVGYNFMGIRFNPGTATYTITAFGSGTATTVSNTEFQNAIIAKLVFDSFDEQPRKGDVSPTDQGNKGTAFDVVCPTHCPTQAPSSTPSTPPTLFPTHWPTPFPTAHPTQNPTGHPTTLPPTLQPTNPPYTRAPSFTFRPSLSAPPT